MKFSSLFLIFVLTFCSSVFAQQYQVEEIAAAPFEKSLLRAGKIAFHQTNKLSFKSQGFLTKLNVKEGDYFSKGDLLASLDNTQLKALKNARYVTLLQAKREVNRIKELIDKELSTQQALELAQSQVDTARELYRITYYDLEKAEIKAPFDGVVLARFTSLNELQQPGNSIVEVAEIKGNIIVNIALTTDEISHVTKGQRAQVFLSGVTRVLHGTVSKVPVRSNTLGNMYLVEVTLEDIEFGRQVVADQLVNVALSIVTTDVVYAVPNSALLETDAEGKAVVLVKQNNGTLHRQAFDIVSIDSEKIYLQAVEQLSSRSNAIHVVTKGWQQFELSEF